MVSEIVMDKDKEKEYKLWRTSLFMKGNFIKIRFTDMAG